MPQESFAKVAKRRVYGVIFLVLVIGFVSLTIAIYEKAFTPTVDVSLKIAPGGSVTKVENDQLLAGNELQPKSDVKIRGLIVGSVGSLSSDGDTATIKLKLEPGMVDKIPSNVYAQILPKTLFGEQYVSLVVPKNPSSTPIKSGAVITPDRSKGALEASTVLGNLYPLLTEVQPAQLNATLTALATALNGRGEELGQTLVRLDKYLRILNSKSATGSTYTAQLVDDLDKLGKVALEYNGVSPDLFASLRNLLTTVRTTVQKRDNLDRLLTSGSGTAGILQSFLSDNQDRIIAVSGQTEKTFHVLQVYSPEYTCLLAGINQLYNKAGQAIYNGAIHLSATVVAPNPNFAQYKQGEEPKFISGYGANCFGLPGKPTPTDSQGHFQIPPKYQCINDGAALTPAGNKPNCSTSAAASSKDTSALNSPAEDAMVNTLIAGDLGTTPNKVPSSSTMLAGPLLRGQDVVVK